MLNKAGYALASIAVALVMMGAGCSSSSSGTLDGGSAGGGVEVNY